MSARYGEFSRDKLKAPSVVYWIAAPFIKESSTIKELSTGLASIVTLVYLIGLSIEFSL